MAPIAISKYQIRIIWNVICNKNVKCEYQFQELNKQIWKKLTKTQKSRITRKAFITFGSCCDTSAELDAGVVGSGVKVGHDARTLHQHVSDASDERSVRGNGSGHQSGKIGWSCVKHDCFILSLFYFLICNSQI